MTLDENAVKAIGYVVTGVVLVALALRRRRPRAAPPPPPPPDGLAVAEPACLHEWEKDGERVDKMNYDGTVWQPARCKRCGEMRSFEL